MTNVNESPTDISLSNSSVAENQPSGTTVGNFTTTDPDAGDTHTYTLVAGMGDVDNASFDIVGNQLRTKASFDYETKKSYSIRVRSTDNGAGSLYFEKQFTITVTDVNEPSAPLTAISPNGGENWAVGSKQNITWNSASLGGYVRIQLSRDGGVTWTSVASHASNSGSLTCTVTSPATTRARIKVSSVSNPSIYDISDANFTIEQRITVISPNSNEHWLIGSKQNITWNSAGVTGYVRIQLSRDGGVTWTNIISITSNDGSQAWTVTSPTTTQARIKVSSVSSTSVFDISDTNFTIAK